MEYGWLESICIGLRFIDIQITMLAYRKRGGRITCGVTTYLDLCSSYKNPASLPYSHKIEFDERSVRLHYLSLFLQRGYLVYNLGVSRLFA